jgi:hypothetical protein
MPSLLSPDVSTSPPLRLRINALLLLLLLTLLPLAALQVIPDN